MLVTPAHIKRVIPFFDPLEREVLARILHAAKMCDNNCLIMGEVNTNSPLLVDKVVTEVIRTYNGNGQGMPVVPVILSGGMGPVIAAASVARIFVLHSVVWLEGGLCTGYEKLLLNADFYSSYHELLGQGLEVSDEAPLSNNERW